MLLALTENRKEVATVVSAGSNGSCPKIKKKKIGSRLGSPSSDSGLIRVNSFVLVAFGASRFKKGRLIQMVGVFSRG